LEAPSGLALNTEVANLYSLAGAKPSISFPTGKQRIIYVACSRPRQFLAMAFPSRVTPAEIQATFGLQVLISPI
jgi:hypothetical protein